MIYCPITMSTICVLCLVSVSCATLVPVPENLLDCFFSLKILLVLTCRSTPFHDSYLFFYFSLFLVFSFFLLFLFFSLPHHPHHSCHPLSNLLPVHPPTSSSPFNPFFSSSSSSSPFLLYPSAPQRHPSRHCYFRCAECA